MGCPFSQQGIMVLKHLHSWCLKCGSWYFSQHNIVLPPWIWESLTSYLNHNSVKKKILTAKRRNCKISVHMAKGSFCKTFHMAKFESVRSQLLHLLWLYIVRLRIVSLSSLFFILWLSSLLKAPASLPHTLLSVWSRWTPTHSHHHRTWLLTGFKSMTRRPRSEYQRPASESM